MLQSKTLLQVMLTLAFAGAVTMFNVVTAPGVSHTPVVSPSSSSTTSQVELEERETYTVEVRDSQPVEQPTQPVEQPAKVTSDGLFVIPSVGVSASLSETTTQNGEVTPPDFSHVFRVTDLQAPVYVAHSCVWEVCLGNPLFNTDTQEVLVKIGDLMEVDGQSYEVTQIRRVVKTELPSDPLWGGTDLAFITCFQKQDRTKSTDNLVVIAHPVK